MFRLLSFPLSASAPVWPGNPPAAQTEANSAIANGDNANTTILHLFSHSGTHLDAPKHFNDAGASAYQLPIDRYIFHSPLVLEVPKPEGGPIHQYELEPYAQQLGAADLAMLRTGWIEKRTSEPKRYPQEGPYLDPEAARYLMTFSKLKGVAIDAVSIGAPYAYPESVATHQALTGVGRDDGHFLLILEDLRIDADLGNARRIYAWPLLIEGSDGSPCTIVAEFPD
ncbi:cyclase family protein [Phototrophicus methaneseepsis]|uniref:Cyclase family protein n=1 Tax=Phototrophicus methaneseepsis TaxID=2710758 RepID=A0A7S8EC93_9CHLR|nr:cyclase family protein [Phototrophicus methaneseepsis]QPC84083.1 cyclase family protein [Phototrophicus methaneseepsis]